MVGANHSTAWGRCDAQGGVLWWPRNASEELAVERWFGLLNNEHGIHLGITRGAASGVGSSWTAADGSTAVVGYPSTAAGAAYAHWGSDHYSSGGPAVDGNQLCTIGQTWSLVGGIARRGAACLRWCWRGGVAGSQQLPVDACALQAQLAAGGRSACSPMLRRSPARPPAGVH
jgi:hypothetical protein